VPDASIIHADCLDHLASMEPGAVDAVVTDPPYGLRFMGRRWDYDVPGVDVWAEVYRVLADGGRLLCFGGTRTMHRIWVNIEDAGFAIEDTVCWLYGSGFPKHGSKLKPAYEPVCVARKGPVTPLNVDACRINPGEPVPGGGPSYGKCAGVHEGWRRPAHETYENKPGHSLGRWPANVAHDGSAEVLDAFARFGEVKGAVSNGKRRGSGFHGNYGPMEQAPSYDDKGTAARFFYCAKASRSEREAGLGHLEPRARKAYAGAPLNNPEHECSDGVHRTGERAPSRNTHPTVKPLALMRWLVRLVTPPGGLVLDPFAGSGTTGLACLHEGLRFVGVEREAEYVEIARARLAAFVPTPKQLEAFADA